MLKLLSEKDRCKIHEAGLAVLEEVGVRLHNSKIYKIMLEAGAKEDKNDSKKLYFPREMVKKYFSMCPRQFEITDRKSNRKIIKSGGESLYFTSNATHYLRGTSKVPVEIGESELIEFLRVVDKLDNVYGVVGTLIKEYEPKYRDFVGFRIMAQYTYKHLRPCIYTASGAEAIIEMADVVLDSKSLRENMIFSLGYSIVSPLTWSNEALELFYRTRGYGIPMMINSEPMAGATSPVTLAGSLAMADAEVISGIVINQVLEPGRPCIYNIGFAHVMDMSTTQALTGAPENALIQAAGSEMAEYHDLPSASWALSDSLMLDSQASYEKMMTLMAHTLSKVNLIWGIGNIESSKTISPEIAVIDNEMIGSCLRFSRGIKVDQEHIALDVIKEVGFDGSFLEVDHTFKHFREEIRHSTLPNRINRVNWEQYGSNSIEEKAEDVVANILSNKSECYLNGTQIDKLLKIQTKWMERI